MMGYLRDLFIMRNAELIDNETVNILFCWVISATYVVLEVKLSN